MCWCVRVMQNSILIPSYTLFKLTAATLPMYRSTIEYADIVPGPTNQLPHSLLEQKSPHEWPSGQCTFTFKHSFNSWTAPEIKIWYHQPAVFPKTFVHLQVTTHVFSLSTFQSNQEVILSPFLSFGVLEFPRSASTSMALASAMSCWSMLMTLCRSAEARDKALAVSTQTRVMPKSAGFVSGEFQKIWGKKKPLSYITDAFNTKLSTAATKKPKEF